MTSRRRYKIWKRFTRDIRERVVAVVYSFPDPTLHYASATSRESGRGFCPLGEAFAFKGVDPKYLVSLPDGGDTAGMLMYGNPSISAYDNPDWEGSDKYDEILEEAEDFINAWDNNKVTDLVHALYLDKENDCV